MADKMTCPSCDAHLSSVLRAFDEGRPCPNCGLPHEAAVQVLAARQRGADEQLIQRLMQAEKELAEAKAEAGKLRWRLRQVESALASEPPDWD